MSFESPPPGQPVPGDAPAVSPGSGPASPAAGAPSPTATTVPFAPPPRAGPGAPVTPSVAPRRHTGLIVAGAVVAGLLVLCIGFAGGFATGAIVTGRHDRALVSQPFERYPGQFRDGRGQLPPRGEHYRMRERDGRGSGGSVSPAPEPTTP